MYFCSTSVIWESEYVVSSHIRKKKDPTLSTVLVNGLTCFFNSDLLIKFPRQFKITQKEFCLKSKYIIDLQKSFNV